MARPTTAAQFSKLRSDDTRPITLVRWEHSGSLELISCSGRVTFNGEVYNQGIADIVSITDSTSAIIEMPADTSRVSQVNTGSWRSGICQIYEIPALPDDDNDFDLNEGTLLIDGVINDSRHLNNTITVEIKNKYLIGKFTPRTTFNEASSHIPAAGSIIGSDSTYTLQSKSTKQITPSQDAAIRGRPSIADNNDIADDESGLSAEETADGAIVPIILGRRAIPGRITCFGVDGSGNRLYQVGWASGEIFQIEKLFIDGIDLFNVPAGSEYDDYRAVSYRNYRGTDYQTADPWGEDITTITGYADDMVVLKPEGKLGIAYTWFKLPSTYTAAPRFNAIIKGQIVYDFLYSAQFGDPFNTGENLLVGYSLEFEGTDGTTPTDLDSSGNDNTNTWFGDADIQSNAASLDGNGDYLTLPASTNTSFGTGPFTLEITFTPTTITATRNLFSKGDLGTDRSVLISQINAGILVNLSSDGTTSDIASIVVMGSGSLVAGQEAKFVLEFTGREYFFYLDGQPIHSIASTDSVFESVGDVFIGAFDSGTATDFFEGEIHGVRLTKTVNRYGGVHGVTASPYADSDAMRPGYLYTNNAVSCLGYLLLDPISGMGSSEIKNFVPALSWAQSLLGGAVVRSTCDLIISESRKTIDWVDILAMYGDCLAFPDGSGFKLIPDRPVNELNPSGWDCGENSDFNGNADGWTLGTGWSYSVDLDYLIKSPGNTNTASQSVTVPTVAGDIYVAKLDMLLLSGSCALHIDGIPYIEAQTLPDIYGVEFVATGNETFIEIVPDSAFFGFIQEASLKPKYWYDDQAIANTIQIVPLRTDDTANRILASYTVPNDDSPYWPESEPYKAEIPSVTSSNVSAVETRLRLNGLLSYEQTANKANAKLYRSQNLYRISWVTTDIGMVYQKGLVVKLYEAEFAQTILVFVESVTRIEPGRYRVTGTRYDDNHYPDDLQLPGGAGTVPVDALGGLLGTTVPTGWELFTLPNGKYIRLTNDPAEIGDTGGSATHAGLSGTTGEGGAHGGEEERFYVRSFTGLNSNGIGVFYTSLAQVISGHDHTFDTGTITPDPYRIEMVLVKKITTAGTVIPKDVVVFGEAGLNYPDMFRWDNYARRLLQADTVTATAGNNNQSIMIGATSSYDDDHDHVAFFNVVNGSPADITFTPDWYDYDDGGSNHAHASTLALTTDVKRISLAGYTGTDDYSVGKGIYFPYVGTASALHPDFIICTGKLGTPEVHRRYLEFAALGEEGLLSGDNAITVDGFTNYSASHNHKGNLHTESTDSVREASHGADVKHRHSISGSSTWEPEYYDVVLIKYDPNPVTTYDDVSLLIGGGFGDGDTDIIDEGPDILTDTVLGTGTLEYDDAVTLFGLSTVLAGGKRMQYPSFDYGKKFTFEGFFRNDSTDAMILFGNFITSLNTTFQVKKNASGDIILQVGDTDRITLSTGFTSGEWFYVGLAYDYREWRLYAGLQSVGTAVGGTYSDANTDVTADLYLLDTASGSSDNFTGHFGQLRATRGAAILTGSIIAVPIEAFPIDKTWLLESGTWDDSGYWLDTATWNDGA